MIGFTSYLLLFANNNKILQLSNVDYAKFDQWPFGKIIKTSICTDYDLVSPPMPPNLK